jgi:hypothetical protein
MSQIPLPKRRWLTVRCVCRVCSHRCTSVCEEGTDLDHLECSWCGNFTMGVATEEEFAEGIDHRRERSP